MILNRDIKLEADHRLAAWKQKMNNVSCVMRYVESHNAQRAGQSGNVGRAGSESVGRLGGGSQKLEGCAEPYCKLWEAEPVSIVSCNACPQVALSAKRF